MGASVVRGNHDAYVTRQLVADPAKVDAYRTEWIRGRLEPDHFEWLAALPVEIRFQWGGRRVCVRHASPWDEETYLYPDSSDLSKVNLVAGEILLVGHTHHPMVKECGTGLLINPGSVGQPRDWNPMAAYVLLDTETASVVQRRVPYDVAKFQYELSSMGWDAKTIEILSRTR
jgi:predicted phosphodiesterase